MASAAVRNEKTKFCQLISIERKLRPGLRAVSTTLIALFPPAFGPSFRERQCGQIVDLPASRSAGFHETPYQKLIRRCHVPRATFSHGCRLVVLEYGSRHR